MPASATATRLVRTAPGAVWKLWRDLPRWRRWHPEVIESAWQGGAAWDQGSSFSLLRRSPYALLRRVPGIDARRFTGRVLSTSDEQLLVWELQPTRAAWLGPVIVESIRLEPAPGGTTVTLTVTAHGVAPSLLAPLLAGPLRSQAAAALEGLHRELSPPAR